MVIETKYNVGDEVWVVVGGKKRKLRIKGIASYCGHIHKSIKYSFEEIFYIIADETDVFSTEEELRKSLSYETKCL
jgi:hypothetical protein